MKFQLGNKTVEEIEQEHSFVLSDEHRTKLRDMRQDDAQNIASNKFHIFDMPRVIRCGSMETATIVYEILKQYDIKGHITIGVI